MTRILPLKAGAGSTLSAGATLPRLIDAAPGAGQPRSACEGGVGRLLDAVLRGEGPDQTRLPPAHFELVFKRNHTNMSTRRFFFAIAYDFLKKAACFAGVTPKFPSGGFVW